MPVWVKICGITRVDDARAAWEAGADAIGLNFVGGPRIVTPAEALPILAGREPGQSIVALVELGSEGLDPGLGAVLKEHQVSHLQLYGRVTLEQVAFLRQQGWDAIPVIRSAPGTLAAAIAPWLQPPMTASCFALLVDTYDPDRAGGTGKRLDWGEFAAIGRSFSAKSSGRLILAGGLDVANVRRAVETARPWGVDVASGVEIAPREKDREAMTAFIREAKGAS